MADQPTASGLDLRWTLSNLISALRIFLALPTAYALAMDLPWIAASLCIAAAGTDMLDGYIARRNNEISDLGKILDPLADKVFVAMLVIMLLIDRKLDLWFVAVVLGRDLLILVGGLLIERRTGVVLPSNYPGKAAVVALSLMLLFIILGLDHRLIDAFMILSLALLGVSLYLYTVRAIAQGRGKWQIAGSKNVGDSTNL